MVSVRSKSRKSRRFLEHQKRATGWYVKTSGCAIFRVFVFPFSKRVKVFFLINVFLSYSLCTEFTRRIPFFFFRTPKSGVQVVLGTHITMTTFSITFESDVTVFIVKITFSSILKSQRREESGVDRITSESYSSYRFTLSGPITL